MEVVKCSLLGSILSNLLLVLGTSLLCGGLANLNEEQKYDRVSYVIFPPIKTSLNPILFFPLSHTHLSILFAEASRC